MENSQPGEKIYVAIGTDLGDGFATLDWALKKWASASVKIVILYAENSTSKDFVYTPIGKIPASSVRKEKLKALDKSEESKADKILSKFIAFCGKVKAEGLRIDRYEEPNHKVILRLITSLHITKLVMAFSFLRPSSWKSRIAANASFSFHQEKPHFCELFLIHEGRLVFLREENNEGFIEDGHGVIIAKMRGRPSFRGWIGKKFFPENASGKDNLCDSPSSATRRDTASVNHWEKQSEDLDEYFNELSASMEKEGEIGSGNDTVIGSPSELNAAENMVGLEKVEVLKIRIRIHKQEAMLNAERCERAKWAVGLCNSRVDELEARRREEDSKRTDLQKDLDRTKEELMEIQSEVEEKRSKLNSILQLQRELSNKLQLSAMAKSRVESQLEKSVRERAEMVQEIEELRRQRKIFQRRIEFCREKDAIGMASKFSDLGFEYKKFTATDIRAATDDFADRLRFKSGGDWTNVYKGRINKTIVAIKLSESIDVSQEAFLENVRLLGSIRHPHVLSMIGFCTDLKCIVYEYMHNRCLRDTIFSRHRSSRGRNRGLNWHDRIRVAAEVCTALSFLHKTKPRPLVHGSLNPSRILLDRNNVAKIYGINTGCSSNATMADTRAFGILLLQLLTGRNWAGIDEEAIMMDSTTLTEALDRTAGQWPLDLAVELAGIARRCLSTDETKDSEFGSTFLMRWIEKVRRNADELIANGERLITVTEEHNVPGVFFCPINQDVMKNPYIAADGFSYELEAIEEWLRTGRETSPMTNLKLKHKQLTPNHTLRSLIEDWHSKRCIPCESL